MFLAQRHLPGRAARAVPVRCQAYSGPVLIDLIALLSAVTASPTQSPGHCTCLQLPRPVCLQVAHGLEWEVKMAHHLGGGGPEGWMRRYPPI